MKRELNVYCLQLGDHQVFVDRGSRAEAHWQAMGYRDSAGMDSVPVEPHAGDGGAGEKPKRRGRKPAGVTGDE